MPHATLESVIEHAKALSRADQLRLRDLLNSWLQEPFEPLTEEEFEDMLVAEGLLISRARTRHSEPDEENEYQPVVTTGPPLSEIIIAERR